MVMRRRVHNFAGIENAAGIEGAFDLPERLVKHRAEHLPVERTAHQAVAVLGGKRAAEFQHQVGYLLRDRLRTSHALPRSSRLITGRTCRQPTEAWA